MVLNPVVSSARPRCHVILFAGRLSARGLGVRCSGGGLVDPQISGGIRDTTLASVIGRSSLPCVTFRRSVYSPLLIRFSWDQSARCDCVQVNLPRCQGDADRCPGHGSHSPPLSVVLVPRARGEVGAGGGRVPDRPAKAVHRRESPTALALAVPARCRTSKWKEPPRHPGIGVLSPGHPL